MASPTRSLRRACLHAGSALLLLLLTTCKEPAGPAKGVEVEATPASAQVAVNKTVQLNALVRNAANPGITWKSQDTTVASVNATGLVQGIKVGSTTIRAISNQDSTRSASVAIQVVAGVEVAIDSTRSFIGVGDTLRFTAAVTGATDPTVTWRTSNPAVANVSPNGLVTGTTPGSVDITAIAAADTLARATASLDVSQLILLSLYDAATGQAVDSVLPTNADTIVAGLSFVNVPQRVRQTPNLVTVGLEVSNDDQVVNVDCPVPSFLGVTQGIACPVNMAALNPQGNPVFANGPHNIKAVARRPDDGSVLKTSLRPFNVGRPPPPAGEPSVVAVNGHTLLFFNQHLNFTGSLALPDSFKLQELGTRCEIFANCSTSALFGTSGGTGATNAVYKLAVNTNGVPLTLTATHRFNEPVFNVAVNQAGNCVGVPLQLEGSIQMLDSGLAPTNKLTLPGSFPTKVVFNPVQPYAYVVDGTRVRVMNVDAACTMSDPGIDVNYPNLRHIAIDPPGDFLYVLTFQQFGASSTVIAQPLTAGLPTGTPVVTTLPASAFQIAVHPSQDVSYVLQEAPNAAIRALTLNRATGAFAVGTAFNAPGVDKVIFDAEATTLYYQRVSQSVARICHVNLLPAGEFSGPVTCSDQPPRGIDSDIVFMKP